MIQLLDILTADKAHPESCFKCRHFCFEYESWEMPHIGEHACRKRPANKMLKWFPSSNAVKCCEVKNK